jgi:hypothetical protein
MAGTEFELSIRCLRQCTAVTTYGFMVFAERRNTASPAVMKT